MAKRAVEFSFTGSTTPYTSYDSTKTNLGDLIMQYTGSNPTDKFAGPMKIGVGRPDEASTPIPGIYPHVISWADKVGCYTTGTVGVSTTAVTGSGTSWLSGGVPVGARIGFGVTEASQVSTWYTIAAVASDTSITLQSSAGTVTSGTSYVIDMTLQKDWVFFADNATAAANRRISAFIFDRTTSLFAWQGYITITYPAGGGNQTIRGMRVIYATYTTGTIGVSGATVTGSGTTWSADRMTVGSRIGFGSTDPTQISAWYYINAVSSDTSLTIQVNSTTSGTGGTAANLSISNGTAYVIEDLKVITATTAVVIASAGLTLVSGITFDDFLIGGTTIAAATTVDKTKAAYSLVDLDSIYSTGTVTVNNSTTVTGSGTAWAAATHLGCMIGFGSTNPASISTWYTITAVGSATSLTISSSTTVSGGTSYVIVGGNGISGGLAIDDKTSWTSQNCYIIEVQAATTPQVYVYNFRANLATMGGVAAGKSPGAFSLVTATQLVTGNTSQTNNGRIGILNHGGLTVNGVKSLYFATTTRICRAPLSGIVAGSNTWVADAMSELPPGGTNTYGLSNTITAVEIADQIDRLIITTTGAGATTAHHRSYLTQYDTSGSRQFDHIFLADTAQQDQSTADSNSVPHPSAQGAALNVWSQGGLVYLSRTGTATTTNITYAVPLGADWAYADGSINQRLITPSLSTPNVVTLSKVFVNNATYLGSAGLTMPTEPFRIYYRTSGISDNSGTWIAVDQTGDLSAADPGTAIQFAIEFRTIGAQCLPNRIYNLCCTYEDDTTDSHYQPSVGQSSTSAKQFAWRFATAFGTTVPALQIELFDAVSGASLLTDTTTSPTGTWEQSTDGGSNWSAYTTSDKTNETTYIRYTPLSLGDNIKVRALLTQA